MPENSAKTSRRIAILLGGNLGNEEAVFDFAVRELAAGGVKSIRRSAIFKSRAVDCVPGTPDFSDQALTGVWTGSPTELLALTQSIEVSAGRPAKHRSDESRILDCDIILFGDEIVDLPNLKIPHPRAQERLFVLSPLVEIAGSWRFPGGVTVAEAERKLRAENY